jgi:hypothetical protein
MCTFDDHKWQESSALVFHRVSNGFHLTCWLSMTLLERDNKRLTEAIQILYGYVQSGRLLPTFPMRSTADEFPSVHDIVEWIDSLPKVEIGDEHSDRPHVVGLDVSRAGLSRSPQPEVLLGTCSGEPANPLLDYAKPSPLPVISSSAYQQEPDMGFAQENSSYNSMEDTIDSGELWNMIDFNNPEAATLMAFLESSRR